MNREREQQVSTDMNLDMPDSIEMEHDPEDLFVTTITDETDDIEKALRKMRLTGSKSAAKAKQVKEFGYAVYNTLKENGYAPPTIDGRVPCRATISSSHTADEPVMDDYDGDNFAYARDLNEYRRNEIAARTQCGECPFRMECLASSFQFMTTRSLQRDRPEDPYIILFTDENYIWGGLDFRERKLVRDAAFEAWGQDAEGPETVNELKAANDAHRERKAREARARLVAA